MNFRQFLAEKSTSGSDWHVVNLYYGHPETSVPEISRKTGKSVAEIYRILTRMGGRPNRQVTNHHNVLMLINSGMPLRQVASLTGYTERNIRHILSKQ